MAAERLGREPKRPRPSRLAHTAAVAHALAALGLEGDVEVPLLGGRLIADAACRTRYGPVYLEVDRSHNELAGKGRRYAQIRGWLIVVTHRVDVAQRAFAGCRAVIIAADALDEERTRRAVWRELAS